VKTERVRRWARVRRRGVMGAIFFFWLRRGCTCTCAKWRVCIEGSGGIVESLVDLT
jgi:hypothetical protein